MKRGHTIRIMLLTWGLLLAGCKQETGNTHQANGKLMPKGETSITIQNTHDTATLHAIFQKCYLLHKEGKSTAAIDCYEQVLRSFRQAGYAEGAAIICYNLYKSYWYEKDYKIANHYFSRFKALLKQVPSQFYNDSITRHRWLLHHRDFEVALAHYEAGNYDTAIHLYLDVIAKMLPGDAVNCHLLGTSYAALGAMYGNLGEHHLAMFYIDKMYAVGKQFADTTLILKALNNKASTLVNNHDPVNALSTARTALSIASSNNAYLSMQSSLQEIIALALMEQQKPEDALIYSKLRMQTARQIANEGDIILASYLLGYNYNQLKAFQKAERYLLSGLRLAEKTGNWVGIHNAYEQLAETYERMGHYVNALRYKNKYVKLQDSIRGAKNAKRVANAEVRYRVAQKDKELAEKDKVLAENKAALYRQRYWLTGSIGGGLILLLSLIGFIRNSRQKRHLYREQMQNMKQQQKIEQMQVKMEAEEQERKRIAQELHDGLGVLLSAAKINHALLGKVQSPAGATKPYREGYSIIDQMQQEVEMITNNLVPDYITQNGLENALNTLAAKFNQPGIRIQLQTYGAVKDLHPDRGFSLYRAIEEIIHNAVKHSGGSQVAIQLMYHPDKLHILIEDNGIGFDTEHIYTGMGLQNIRNRINKLQGYLNLSSQTGKGTTYILEVPY